MTIKHFSITEAMNFKDDKLTLITEDIELYLENGTLQIKVNFDDEDTPYERVEKNFGVQRIEHARWTVRDEDGKIQKRMVR